MAKKAVKKSVKKVAKSAVADKAEELACICAKIADDHKADNVITLKVSGLSVIADYFVICAGNSIPHISAICDSITREVRAKMDKRPRTIDGTPASQWTVIDYGNVIVHVFHAEDRSFYSLEKLWSSRNPQISK